MSASTLDADFLRAKEKVKRGTDFRDTVAVDLGDETVEFGYRLLNESEFDRVKQAIPMDQLSNAGGEELDEDEQARLEELSERDPESLSESERAEIEELANRSSTLQLLSSLDAEANDAIRNAGKQAILPTPEDVAEVKQADFQTQVQVLGRNVAEGTGELTDSTIESAIKQDIKSFIDDQPFPIKRTVGLYAFVETMRVQGNGL